MPCHASDLADTDAAPQPAAMPVPDRLNTALVVLVVSAAVGLLWFASQLESWYAITAIGVVFSYLLLSDYALLHEATHDNLHSRPNWNYGLGVLTGLVFPTSFSMVHYTHRNHHRYNRTDREMFDLYYPTDNLLLKYLQWYSILCGLFWPLVPLGSIVFSFWPGLLQSRLIAEAEPARGLYYVSRIPAAVIRATRFETLLTIVFFIALFAWFELRWQSTLVLYGCFAFNWSTRQYITHAFTKRDVVEGAFNLRHNWLMSWLLLHGEWDLNHHRRPDVSWYYLPQLSPSDEPRISYVRQYWRQWRGPVPAREAAPEPRTQQPSHTA